MKKRLLSIFLVYCMVLLLMPTAMLADSTAVVEVETVEAEPGGTVEIPVNITTNPGIAGLIFSISYDETVLTLKSITRGEVLSGGFMFTGDKDRKLVQWAAMDGNATASGVMFILEFEVGTDATNGIYNVSINETTADLSNLDGNNVDSSFKPGAVKITSGPVSNYSVTLNTGNGGTASVNKASAQAGEIVTVMTVPDSGYELDKVTYTPVGGTAVDITSEKFFEMPAANVTVNVSFKEIPAKSYAVQVSTVENGTVNVNKTSALAGETVSVTAAPASGYELDTITYTPAGGTAVDITSTKSFEMPAADVTVTASFKEIPATSYAIQVNTAENGTASVNKTSALAGETVSVTATPANGYELDKITYTPAGGTTVDITSAKSFKMPAADVTVTVSFKEISTASYEVQVSTVENGTVSVSKTSALAGETVSVTATPANGYELDKITYTPAGGTTVDITSAKSFKMPAASVTVHAVFKATAESYAVKVNGGSGSGRYTPGTLVTITADDAPSGKRFKEWTGTDGLTFTSGSKTTQVAVFTMPAKEVSVTAVYENTQEYVISFDANGGTVSQASVNTSDGRLSSLPVPSRSGYRFEGWYTAPSGGTRIKTSSVFSKDTTIYAHWRTISTGGGGTNTPTTTTYTVSIPAQISGGKVSSSPSTAKQGDTVTLTVSANAGYELKSVTVKTSSGRTISLNNRGNGQYSFTMPNSRVSVDASFSKIADNTSSIPAEDEPFTGLGTPGISGIVLNPAPTPFTDVPSDSWFYNSVEYMWKHYLMSGVSDTQFAPEATTSRAMIWTILARMNNVRTDVNPGSTWYERGMLWAMEQSVTDGTNPMADISREQLATMLWRNAGSPSSSADLNQFSDSGSVSDYASSAMRWAVASGILQGSDGKLNPKGTATRAQVATMVMRYGERIGT